MTLASPRPDSVSAPAAPAGPSAWLRRAGVLWFLIAATGQLAFVWFIAAFYGTRTAAGDFAAWNDKPLIDGHQPGDAAGNLMFVTHVLLAAAITLGGLAQLIPQLRNRARAFHRWNGRAFLVIAYVMALGGLWLVWGRGTYLSLVSGVAVSLNGVLIIAFATLAWREAAARRIESHRRWAMRAFMAVNGVWFLRVGLMAWVLINQGPVGMNRTLSGPADIVLVFGSYLIPLAVLELYFRAQRSRRAAFKWIGAGTVAAAAAVTAIGVFGTVALMWRPYL